MVATRNFTQNREIYLDLTTSFLTPQITSKITNQLELKSGNPMMMREKERESGSERVVVVLDAFRASTERGGVAPLKYAMREVVKQNDEVLVLTIVDSGADESPLTSVGCCCNMRDGRFDQFSSEGDSYISVVHEISQRKDAFAQIFRPYYDICKSIGVKFQVKIAASFQPQAWVVEEANNVNATWIVMDRCFSGDQSFQMNGTQCNVVIVNCDEKIVAHNDLPLKDAAETSGVQLYKHVPKSTNPDKQKNLAEESHFDYLSPSFQIQHVPFPPLTSTSKELGESSNKSKRPRKNGELTSTVNLGTRMPLKLSWEMVEEITCGFTRMTCVDETKSFKLYCGYLSDHHPQVLVKRFSSGQFDDVLEAEKKAASSMYHKNILGLIGYHKSDYATVLVHPFSRQGTLDKFLHGSKGRQVKLTFQEKIDTVIRIGQGVRYMHEECPRGPIVHRDLRPCNILMKADLEPLITGFGKAKWLQLDRASTISNNRLRLKNPSDIEALALVKSDIFQFGILLLRLFCRRFAPQNDEIFLEWARPLLKQMAYHKLLEEDVEYLDTYGAMRVMWAAAQCIEPRPILRPNISEVISLLKGETSCAVQSSPSSEGSPNLDLCAFNLSPYRVVNTVKEY